MLEKVKIALRIEHDFLDNDIIDTISSARAEMIRSGILEEKTMDEEDSLITNAIKTFCLYVYSESKTAEGYLKSWNYQLDCLRKSSGYMKEGGSDV